jgi:hypothetical protein
MEKPRRRLFPDFKHFADGEGNRFIVGSTPISRDTYAGEAQVAEQILLPLVPQQTI